MVVDAVESRRQVEQSEYRQVARIQRQEDVGQHSEYCSFRRAVGSVRRLEIGQQIVVSEIQYFTSCFATIRSSNLETTDRLEIDR